MSKGVTHIFGIQDVASGGAQSDLKYGMCMGTYIGAGSATAYITASGLKSIHHVFMTRSRVGYSGATTNGRLLAAPCIAVGTPGSFYPIILRVAATNANVTLNGASATWCWWALGGGGVGWAP